MENYDNESFNANEELIDKTAAECGIDLDPTVRVLLHGILCTDKETQERILDALQKDKASRSATPA